MENSTIEASHVNSLGSMGLKMALDVNHKPQIAKLLNKKGCQYSCKDEIKYVSESDPHFVAKSMLAMTILRASYQHANIVDEAELKILLGDSIIETAIIPPGFYLMGPGNKIAASFFAQDQSTTIAPSNFEDWSKDIQIALALPCWTTRMQYDFDAFKKSSDPFADWLLAADDKRLNGLKDFGLMIKSTISGRVGKGSPAKPIIGYPAPLAAPVEWDDDIAAKRINSEEFAKGQIHRKASRMKLVDLWRLPFLNHNASSPINNTRDIRDVLDRSTERALIIKTLAQEWFARSRILSGALDHEMPLDQSGKSIKSRILKVRQEEALRAELDPLGKARILYCAPISSTIINSTDESLILSADMALVDGQHSSRDYWLISLSLSGKIPKFPNVPDGTPIQDCSLDNIRKIFEEEINRLTQDGQEDSKGSSADSKPVELPYPHLKGDAAFKDFADYVGRKETVVELRANLDPDLARTKTVVENEQRQQEKSDKAMAQCHAEIQEFSNAFNRGAEAAKDIRRMIGIKSAHNDESFSARSSQYNIDIKAIFRVLSSLATPDGSFDAKRDIAQKIDLENKSRDYALVDAQQMWPDLNDDEREPAVKKMTAIYESLGNIKSRNFDISVDRLKSAFNNALDGTARRVHGSEFIKTINRHLKAQHGVKAEAIERKDPQAYRAYTIGLAALEIGEILNLKWKAPSLDLEKLNKLPPKQNKIAQQQMEAYDRRSKGNAALSQLYGQSTLETLILRLAVDRFRTAKNESQREALSKLSIASIEMKIYISEAMDRLRERALDGSLSSINLTADSISQARSSDEKAVKIDMKNKRGKNKEDSPKGKGGYIKEHIEKAKTFFDAVPLPGPSYIEMEKLQQKRAAAKGAKSTSKNEGKH